MKKLFKRVITGVLSLMMTSVTVLGNTKAPIKTSQNDTGIYTVVGDVSTVPEILAESAIIVDMKTGYTLMEKNVYDKHYPASITKVMTAILTLEQVALDETVTFSHDAVFSIESGSSAAYVDEGEQLSVEQCLYGLMLISGNDLANGLAEHVGGSMENFAVMMTNKAKELGCLNTNFTNAHGLHDENHYTCAFDMAIMAKYAYENLEMFRTLCSTTYYECSPTNKQPEIRYWRNTNKLIGPGYRQYYEDCLGGKTGYTNQAGGTLVTYAKINGRVLLGVFMKSSNSAGAYADTTAWYEYIRSNVTEDMYKAIDDKYELENNPPTEAITEHSTDEKKTVAEVPVHSEKTDEKESGGFWFGWIIIIVLVLAFAGYYAYVRYIRYTNEKRRLERRRRRLEEEQNED